MNEPIQPLKRDFPNWINPWGVVACFLAAVALLLAALAIGWYFILALCGLALGSCLVGFIETPDQRKTADHVWLSLGSTASAAILLVVLLRPDWLNDDWALDKNVAPPDRNKKTLVSFDNKNSLGEVRSSDWVDAQHHAIRQHDVLIRVERVIVDRPPGQEAGPPSAKAVLVTLHIGNVGLERMLPYRGAAQEDFHAVLRDDHGRELATRKLPSAVKKGGPVAKVSIMPQGQVRDLLVFEAPPAGAAYLELEVPAAAWGREGVCKFKIPRSLIQVKTPNR